MTGTTTGTTTAPAQRLGTLAWEQRSCGQLTGAESRALMRPLARTHIGNVAGRTAMLLRLHSGRKADVPERAMRTPTSVLTKTAEQVALERLTPALLHHSYRCYSFGVALASIEQIDVDRELLFAASMLHDIGLATPVPCVDFTLASALVARDVAEIVGLSTAATEIMRTAITLHHSPGVTLADGPVAYLMSAGDALDVIGLRSWKLPPHILKAVVADHPRSDFKREFRRAWAAEAAAVPRGRARLLRRYGAFDFAIRLAPFAD